MTEQEREALDELYESWWKEDDGLKRYRIEQKMDGLLLQMPDEIWLR